MDKLVKLHYSMYVFSPSDKIFVSLLYTLYLFRFVHTWYAFIELLDIEYDDGFSCPQCGDQPQAIVMDGVTVGTKKHFLQWYQHNGKCPRNEQLDG